jgi:hypothetical protein
MFEQTSLAETCREAYEEGLALYKKYRAETGGYDDLFGRTAEEAYENTQVRAAKILQQEGFTDSSLSVAVLLGPLPWAKKGDCGFGQVAYQIAEELEALQRTAQDGGDMASAYAQLSVNTACVMKATDIAVAEWFMRVRESHEGNRKRKQELLRILGEESRELSNYHPCEALDRRFRDKVAEAAKILSPASKPNVPPSP